MGVVGVATVGVAAMVGVLIVLERVAPARALEPVSGWWLKCLAFIPMIAIISTVVPWWLDPHLEGLALVPGDRLGLVGGAVVAIVASELVIYWVHRLHHELPFLWRWVHQLHHSAERVDVLGAAYFHPFEILEGSVVGAFFFSVLLGVTPEAAGLAILWQAANGAFQHGNIRTPRWLGYFIQRPESHGIHHQRGVHGFNYSNLPLWDMVFGTFRNPASFDGAVGFYEGSSKPTVDMLLGRDISRGAPTS